MTEGDDRLFSGVSHGRTADEVVQQIELLILDGVLRDGDRLPGERELAQSLEVSRPILRDGGRGSRAGATVRPDAKS